MAIGPDYTSKVEKVKNYLLEFPNATKEEVMSETGASKRTYNTARAELIKTGIAPPSWVNTKKFIPHKYKPQVIESVPNLVVTRGRHEKISLEDTIAPFAPLATVDLYKLLDAGEDPDIDDEKTRVAMLKQLRLMSFDASLHQSIRMSAMDLYNKLKETARGQTIGPGKPLNHAEALDRLCLLFKAVGATLVLEATAKVFALLGEPDGPTTQEHPPNQAPISEGTI
jgi:hypothetical protein